MGVSGHEDLEMTGQGPTRAAWANGLSSHGEAGGVSNRPATLSGSRSRTKGSPHAGRRGWRDLDHRLLDVLGRITERDRQLCGLLEDHRVLTTAQVADVGFTGQRRARTRLTELYALDVLERFRPRTETNSGPYHWVLGPLGAALVAAEAGVDVAELDWRRGLVHDLAASQRLAHLVGVNGFFTALLRSVRTRSGCRLEEWWSERRCRREWGEVVRPDGYGVWVEHGASMPFLLEHDNGTERLNRLADKLDGYADLAVAAGHRNWVLFTFPTPRREVEARRVLAHHSVPVVTAARAPDFTPGGAVWLPIGDPGPRRRLVQLADFPLDRGRPPLLPNQ
jgi:hypothetical protein